MTEDSTQEPVVESLLVKSTVHLPQIGIGAIGRVDPRVPYIAGCLERGFLVPVEEQQEPEQEQIAETDAEVRVEDPPSAESGDVAVEPDETRDDDADADTD